MRGLQHIVSIAEMKYLYLILTAAASGAAAYFCVDKKENRRTKKQWVIISLLTLSAVCVSLKILYDIDDTVSILKMCVPVPCLIGSACVDFREKRIPNLFPLIIALSGIVLLAAGYFSGQDGAMSYIISSVFATAVVSVVMVVVSVISKHGIGMGDVKLMASLALIGGVYSVIGTLFFSVAVCAAAGLILLITKRGTIKTELPFAPFILTGYYISVFLTSY